MDAMLRKKSHKHLEYLKELLKNESDEKEILSKAYIYTKSIISDFYNGFNMDDAYSRYIKTNLALLEGKYKSRIIDQKSNFKKGKTIKDFDCILDYVVYLTREYISYGINEDFDEINLIDKCHEAAIYIQKKCMENNISSSIIKIIPGYDINAHLYGSFLGYHFANIILFNNNYYLVDVTYSQFFYTKNNIIDRIGLVNIPPCYAGLFMMMSETGKNMAHELIEKGYIKLDKIKLKTYLDAFTMSNRNGLYYESTNDFSFETEYSLSDYEKLLNSKMSQVDIEGRENLGYQSRPLKDYQMVIKKK